MRNHRVWKGIVTGVLAAGTLAGCGNDFADESVVDIQKAAVEDMKSLESVTLSGTLSQDGRETRVDLELNKEGECRGTLEQDGGTAELIGVQDASYLKGDETFWVNSTGSEESAQQVLQVLGDKWALIPPEQADFASLCDLEEVLGDIDDEDMAAEKGEESEVDGESAVAVVGEDDDGGEITAWVAVDDPHYLLKLEKEGGEESGSFTFSDFDEPVDIEAPAEEDVVDLRTAG